MCKAVDTGASYVVGKATGILAGHLLLSKSPSRLNVELIG